MLPAARPGSHMNRREKARQHKRKARERRLRQQRHAAQARPAGAGEFEPELLDDTASPQPDNEPLAEDAAEVADLLACHDEERRQRRVARALDAQSIPDEADRERAAAELADKTPEDLDAAFGPDPVERAHDLALRAWDADEAETAAALARQALALDGSCIDARTILAVQEPRPGRCIELLTEVVDDAARALGGELFLAREKGRLGRQVRARPYLRARHARLQELVADGRTDAAIAEGRALLDLDPDDVVQARTDLCGALLERGDLQAARDVLDAPHAGLVLSLLWARVLERFLSGEQREAASLHRTVRRVLPQVEDLILGRAVSADPEDLQAWALDEIAADAYVPLARAWRRHKAARRWLADGAPASTAAERRAAPESYRPPVSALLRLGEPVFGAPGRNLSRWPAYLLEYRLGAEHVPELLRMAADPALHEQDGSKAAVWAPVHAWRALGLFAAQGVHSAASVAGLLLRRLPNDPDDDWTHEDTVHVLGLVGAPAFDEATALLADRTLHETVRGTIACALAEIGARHATMREEAIGTLAVTVCESVHDVESARHTEPQAALDELAETSDSYVAGLVVTGLMQLHAGSSVAGTAMITLVERAMALGLVRERDCGTREDVLAEMRGETTSPLSEEEAE